MGFVRNKNYKEMRAESNQPAKLYATAKTHKFEDLNDITVENLKFRPIIDQTGTFTYNAAKVIGDYLRPLCKNQYNISDTQEFLKLIKELPPLNDDEQYVSYDVDSLFTNIPLKETINHILDEIYDNKKLQPICNRLIFKRLLYKLTTDCTFQFNQKFYKQTDGCSMGGPLSVILSDIWMTKMENEIVIPKQPKFYKRYVDDIINRRKINEPDELFHDLNNFHNNINLTIEVNPTKFLDTKLSIINGKVSTSVNRKTTKLPVPWSSRIPKRYKRNAIIGDLHRSKRTLRLQTLAVILTVSYVNNHGLKMRIMMRWMITKLLFK